MPGPDHVIPSLATSITAFVGFLRSGVQDLPVMVRSYRDFEREFGAIDADSLVSLAVHEFFLNGGRQAVVVRVGSAGTTSKDDLIGTTAGTGMNALQGAADFNLLCIPDTFRLTDLDATTVAEAGIRFCEASQAFYLVDAPAAQGASDIVNWVDGLTPSANAAVYFPAIIVVNPRDNTQQLTVPPSGSVAGVIARTDTNRGVWKAPAGMEASLNGVIGLALSLNAAEIAALNSMRVNPLRDSVAGRPMVWAARTLAGANSHVDQFRYVSVRRLALYIEQCLSRGMLWCAFVPNNEALWAQLRLDVGAFMHRPFRDGALQGSSAKDAYYVRCGRDTTTASDIEDGVVIVEVGFAPSRPAEFVILHYRQATADGAG